MPFYPPELAVSLLAPPAAPAPSRDPFNLKAAAPKKSPVTRATQSDGGPRKGAATGQGTAPHQKPRPAASGLTLSATLLRGERRVALINGKFFTEGDPLKDVTAGGVTLARVYPDRVLLRQGEETVELKFSDRSESKTSSPGVAKPATKPAGPRNRPR